MKRQSELFQDDLFQEVDTKRYGPSREELNKLLEEFQAKGGQVRKIDEVTEPRVQPPLFNAWRTHAKGGYARKAGK